jgi:hypothetical protein
MERKDWAMPLDRVGAEIEDEFFTPKAREAKYKVNYFEKAECRKKRETTNAEPEV